MESKISEFEGIVYELESRGFFNQNGPLFYKEIKNNVFLRFCIWSDINNEGKHSIILRMFYGGGKSNFLVYENYASKTDICNLLDKLEPCYALIIYLMEFFNSELVILDNFLEDNSEYKVIDIGNGRSTMYMKIDEHKPSFYSRLNAITKYGFRTD